MTSFGVDSGQVLIGCKTEIESLDTTTLMAKCYEVGTGKISDNVVLVELCSDGGYELDANEVRVAFKHQRTSVQQHKIKIEAEIMVIDPCYLLSGIFKRVPNIHYHQPFKGDREVLLMKSQVITI